MTGRAGVGGRGGRNRNPQSGHHGERGAPGTKANPLPVPLAAHLSAGAVTFVPGGPGSSLSSGAAAFSPEQASSPQGVQQAAQAGGLGFSSGAAAFVPGQQAWGWQQAEQNGGAWASGGGPGGYWAGGYAAGGDAFPTDPPAAAASGGGACVFNLDAYSTESSSASSTPRNGYTAPAAVAAGAAEGAVGSAGPPVPASPGPAVPAQLASPALTAGSEPHCALEAAVALESQSESEWSVLDAGHAAQHVQDGARCDVAAEMSERQLKRWLQRFADDGDAATLGAQWRAWCRAESGADRHIAEWLVRCGLDDCMSAGPVIAVLTQLLVGEGLNKDLARRALNEFSDEDLEDMQLDNPKVADFVDSLRAWLSSATGSASAPAPRAPGPAEGPPKGADPKAGSVGLPTNGSSGPAVTAQADAAAGEGEYSFATMLAVRRAMKVAGIEPEPGAPRWRTEGAAGVCEPVPQWATRMAQGSGRATPSGSSKKGGGGGGDGEEWRTAGRAVGEDSRMGRRQSARQKESSSSVRQALPESSTTSWAAQVKRMKDSKAATEADPDNDERFLREMRSSLNKLTVEKFNQLSEHIISMISQTRRPNRGIPMLMQLVFEKATTQHHFIGMYVNLCVKLHRWLTDGDRIAEMESQCNFKRILLNQCQTSFERYLEPPEGFEGLAGDELYEAQVKYKTKMLGNIKLVGELIRHGMLAPKIAIAVAAELVRDDPIVLEERLETLAVFLETVGPVLDDKSWSHYSELQDIFTEVQRFESGGVVVARTRFLLRDLLDLRRSRWQVQKVRDLETDKPMTIEQVHEKARQDHTPASRSHRSGSLDSTPAMLSRTRSTGSDWGGSSRRKSHVNRPTSLGDLDAVGNGPSFVGASPAASSTSQDPPSSVGSRSAAAAALAAICTAPGARGAGSAKGTPKTGSSATLGGGGGTPQVQPRAAALAASPTNETVDRAERLKLYQRDIAQVMRQVSSGGMEPAAAARRLGARGPLMERQARDEAVDLIARLVDEPRGRRRQLLPLLPALADAGVFAPRRVLNQAVEAFVKDAFADGLEAVDPPDLGDIVMRELLPVLGLRAGDLQLPPCLSGTLAD